MNFVNIAKLHYRLVKELDRLFTTTNLIENLNSQLAKHLRRIKRWTNAEMKSRWITLALVEIEGRMRRVNNYEKLHLLRTAKKSDLKLNQRRVA